MGLGPDEVGLGEADPVEALELFETQRKEFLRLGLRDHPTAGWGQEAFAVPAERDGSCCM